uniref:Uncharacterized protein n=1 Tax=Octopus bimaculoides TaxID=37653 RepID=A0A0L8FR63_OCTBM
MLSSSSSPSLSPSTTQRFQLQIGRRHFVAIFAWILLTLIIHSSIVYYIALCYSHDENNQPHVCRKYIHTFSNRATLFCFF